MLGLIHAVGEGYPVQQGLSYRRDKASALWLNLKLWRLSVRFRLRRKYLCEGEYAGNKRFYFNFYWHPTFTKDGFQSLTHQMKYQFDTDTYKFNSITITNEALEELLIEYSRNQG